MTRCQLVAGPLVLVAFIDIIAALVAITCVATGTGATLARSFCVSTLRQRIAVTVALEALVDILAALFASAGVSHRTGSTRSLTIRTHVVTAFGALITITLPLVRFAQVLVRDGRATPDVCYTPTVAITTIHDPRGLTFSPGVFKGLIAVVPGVSNLPSASHCNLATWAVDLDPVTLACILGDAVHCTLVTASCKRANPIARRPRVPAIATRS